GAFFGFLKALKRDGQVVSEGHDAVWRTFQEIHPQTQTTLEQIHTIEKKEVGDINYQLEQLRLAKKVATRTASDHAGAQRLAALDREIAQLQQQYETKSQKLKALYQENGRYHLIVQAAGGREKELPVAAVVRAFLPNQMTWGDRLRLYVTRL